jgi:hypothetical protein
MKILYNRDFLDTFENVQVVFKEGTSFTLPEIVRTEVTQERKKKLFGSDLKINVTTKYTAIRQEQYPLVKFLVEEKGYSFEASLVISAELCVDCLNIALLELQLDYNGIKCYKPSNPEVKCAHCTERKKLYDPKQPSTSFTTEEKREGSSI